MAKPFYDVFITHTYEEHGKFVNALVLALKKNGLRVWYLSVELKLKSSITTSITRALKQSRYGIVILSPVYLSKKWAVKELGTLLNNKKIENRILLILCQVPVKLLKEKKSPLADKYTISSRRGMNHVLAEILGVIAKEERTGIKASQKRKNVQGKHDKEEDLVTQNLGVIVLGGSTEN